MAFSEFLISWNVGNQSIFCEKTLYFRKMSLAMQFLECDFGTYASAKNNLFIGSHSSSSVAFYKSTPGARCLCSGWLSADKF